MLPGEGEPQEEARCARGPLHGIRIIDLTTVVMGPYASQILGEYGAEVIKIEAPGGDTTREIGPRREDGMAALFLGVNRNKQSVVLDLKTEEGRSALLRLAKTSDVFMHNMRPEKLKALGLAAETLRQENDRLVFAGLVGFASHGPYAGMPAYDDVIQGLSGMAALMEMQCGTPRYIPTTLADKVGSLYAVNAITSALVQRDRTGRGTTLEVPMFESVVSFGLVEHFHGEQFDPPASPIGYRRAVMPERRPCATRDGYLCIMPYNDAHWDAFLREVGDDEALSDPRFSTMAQRASNVVALYERLASHIAQRSTDDWLAVCNRLDIPAARMNRLEDLQNDPHLMAVGHFAKVDDKKMGTLVFPVNPVRFDGWRACPTVPPRLGEHTAAVLAPPGDTSSPSAKGGAI